MLCFIDESGTAASPDPEEVFVLGGVIIPVNAWGVLDAEVDQLKSQYGLEKQEIHSTHLYAPYGTQELIGGFEAMSWQQRREAVRVELAKEKDPQRRKNALKRYEDHEPYMHLSRTERIGFLKHLCCLLAGFGPASVVAIAADLGNPKLKPGAAWLSSLQQLTTWFESCLMNTAKKASAPDGSPEPPLAQPSGLLVHDQIDRAQVIRIQMLMRLYDRLGRRGLCPHFLGPSPLFVDSKLTSVVQLADLVAFAVRKCIRYDDATLYDALEPGLAHTFHLSKSRGSCPCRICARYAD